jgi:hypothetical protein
MARKTNTDAGKRPSRVNEEHASAKPKAAAGTGTRSAATRSKAPSRGAKPVLLSGGNPQIPKGYGDAPVQAFIERTVPGVRKAVKWNSPFYGVEDDVWFLSFHVFAKYVKVTFFRGASLNPPPAGKSKYEAVRYYDIYEDQFDEAQFADWVKQASQLPGEKM